ncbi:spore protease YyaC [Cohnella thailandensis]|uniref:Spore protease YyaC n=1 Tax=Cohnella thailandensis TaxID=557557 RepID=A0A841SV22_9BACL|nr:spore protease YyaC [Cohnella thailandensis]MBB6634048.1 spore protease YyaC [Cohnella thailandensis]MBP1972460.1 putative sporulation protein YyaC [Cohnella thailandensis]
MNGAWEKRSGSSVGDAAPHSLKIHYNEPAVLSRLTQRLESQLEPLPQDRRIVVVCVGTDRSTGDSLGPLVGSSLSREDHSLFDLYGTLDDPVHAMNLSDTLEKIARNIPQPYVIAVDACLGQVSSVGCIQIGSGPVRPGAGVNKDLPPVGDIHLTGIVNVGGFMEYFVLQNTRLNLVIKMSDIIAATIRQAIRNSRANRSNPIPFAMPD